MAPTVKEYESQLEKDITGPTHEDTKEANCCGEQVMFIKDHVHSTGGLVF